MDWIQATMSVQAIRCADRNIGSAVTEIIAESHIHTCGRSDRRMDEQMDMGENTAPGTGRQSGI